LNCLFFNQSQQRLALISQTAIC